MRKFTNITKRVALTCAISMKRSVSVMLMKDTYII
uniref:Uncharacterized protein n=1 Tax=Rhizophora mucronata TaxID=61149 RepID=A0A2P2MZX9_RHIMU